MWQTKRSLLNALTRVLTFPVNLEGRQGGHLCCGGRAQAAETVFIITPTKPCQRPRAVWRPAACGREITINNEKSESQEVWNISWTLFCETLQSPTYHYEFYILTVILISVISEGIFQEVCGTKLWQVHRCTSHKNSCPNMLTNLIWLTIYLMYSFWWYKSNLLGI